MSIQPSAAGRLNIFERKNGVRPDIQTCPLPQCEESSLQNNPICYPKRHLKKKKE